jgi:hypothetical protein
VRFGFSDEWEWLAELFDMGFLQMDDKGSICSPPLLVYRRHRLMDNQTIPDIHLILRYFYFLLDFVFTHFIMNYSINEFLIAVYSYGFQICHLITHLLFFIRMNSHAKFSLIDALSSRFHVD